MYIRMGKSRVLVVGGTGYVGRRIVKASLAEGHETYVLQRPEIGLDIDKLQMLLSFKKQGAHLVPVILRPAKPQFSLQQVDIYQLSLLGSHINSSIQLTLLSKNPNQKVAIYYDDFQVYATYKGQLITSYTNLPPFYQDHEESNLLTASLVGEEVPVAPSLGYEMVRDQTVGRLVLNLKVSGRLRWKVATWVTGHYAFHVHCVSVMEFEPSLPPAPLTSNQAAKCSTTV